MVSAQFLHNELPVRLAHRVAELENLPFGLSDMPQVLDVRDWYVESFTELRQFPRSREHGGRGTVDEHFETNHDASRERGAHDREGGARAQGTTRGAAAEGRPTSLGAQGRHVRDDGSPTSFQRCTNFWMVFT